MAETNDSIWEPSPMNSLLSIHLSAMDAGVENLTVEEVVRVERFRRRLPQPKLFGKKAWSKGTIVGLLALVAALAALIAKPKVEEDITLKGQTHAFLVVERGNERTSWDGVDELKAGDRIGAEIVAGESMIGLMMAFDRNGQALMESEAIAANMIEVAAGERKFFAQGFELTDPSDGETVVILACRAPKMSLDDLPQFIQRYARTLGQIGEKNFPNFCWTKSTRLRN